jgi:hypothetical protein
MLLKFEILKFFNLSRPLDPK